MLKDAVRRARSTGNSFIQVARYLFELREWMESKNWTRTNARQRLAIVAANAILELIRIWVESLVADFSY